MVNVGGRVSSSGDDRLTKRLAPVPDPTVERLAAATDPTAELFSGSLTPDSTTPPWLTPAPVPAQLLPVPPSADPAWQRKAERTARRAARRAIRRTDRAEPAVHAGQSEGGAPVDKELGDKELGGKSRGGPPRRLSITLVIAAVAVGIAFLAQLVGARATGATDQPVTTVHGDSVDLTRPFATTPAADWTNGAAGIVAPTAQPVGTYSAAQVASAYAQVRQVLIAAHLATTTLIDHDLTGYLNLLAPSVRPHMKAALNGAGLGKDGGEITMIENGFTLLPVPIKVSGAMSASVSSTGALVVHTNYVFAYPFAPPNSASITSAWQVVAVAHVIEDFPVAIGANYAVEDQGLWPGSSVGYYSSMACGPAALGYLAPEYSQPYTGPTSTVDPDQDYRLDRPAQTATTC